MVDSWLGQPTVAELERAAELGERPRVDYVELARMLDADVVDSHYLAARAPALVRLARTPAGFETAQILAVYQRRRAYRHIVAWGDRLGMGLAAMLKATGTRSDLVMVSHWLSTSKKSAALRHASLDTAIRVIVNYSSVQLRRAAELGVPPGKLALALQPVDLRFWQPDPQAPENLVCAVGSEARDYRTLVEAVRDLDLSVEIAVGTVAGARDALPPTLRGAPACGLPPNVTLHEHRPPRALRALYARSRFAVVPLRDMEFDAGVTAITEAMAMGKAVIATRTRGQVDVVEHGVNGLYVPPRDVRALRQAIERLAADPAEAARMGMAGRQLVERRHGLDRYLERFAAIVESDRRGLPDAYGRAASSTSVS